MKLLPMQLLRVAVAVTAVKLLLVPGYRSTDFEVHRNWMAVTHSLPLEQWYVDETSEWTLDYPPLFAWFEHFLAKVAVHFDPEMLVVENLNYASEQTILFQRLSVIVSDVVFIAAAWIAVSRWQRSDVERTFLFGALVGNAGLLMVDHVHFQYNGLLIGILLWSVLCIEIDACIPAAILFSLLLNMKHLFLFSAPIYFSYMLKWYCLRRPCGKLFAFFKLALSVLSVLVVSFGPFLVRGQLSQVMTRLFPFARGLCHSNWAANFWALYSFADKVLAQIRRIIDPEMEPFVANMSGGLVGETSFLVLPNVPPTVTALFVFSFALLPAIALFRHPQKSTFMECVAYANFCGFIWGYHVHEKAILPVLLPLTLVALRDIKTSVFPYHKNHIVFVSTVAHYSLTPLLHEPQEYPIKHFLVLCFAFYLTAGIQKTAVESAEMHDPSANRIVTRLKQLLLVSLLLLEISQLTAAVFQIETKYEFLPLMLTSVLCAAGLFSYWTVWTCHMLKTAFSSKPKEM